MKIPRNPKIPKELKNRFISVPEANPAPTKVPIIRKIILKTIFK